MNKFLFTNCSIVDATHHSPRVNMNVLVNNGIIEQISAHPIVASDAENINLNGKTLMPGLIDAHVHITAIEFDLANEAVAASEVSVQAARFLEEMLQRGFTSVRDAGGADMGLANAVNKGLIAGSRLFYCGKALSQTGGHGDFRSANIGSDLCSCSRSGSNISRIADGVTEVRKAVRDEVRKGATHIKIMSSGGVASSTDRITNLQYSREEISAIVEEAANAGIYVMAHAYLPQAISRCAELGVRTIEHGNLLDEDSAKKMAEYGVYLVPTLVTYEALYHFGKQNGISDEIMAKVDIVRSSGLNAIKIAHANGVKIGFGTDLLGVNGHLLESQEFKIRSEIETPFQILESATLINAEIINQTGKLGVVAIGAIADLLVVNGNPLTDITLLSNPNKYLDLIMKDGIIYKNQLACKPHNKYSN